MERFNFFEKRGFAQREPVKTELIVDRRYKLVTVGVETGVTIPPCVMNSEMVFYVVEGSGSITTGTQTQAIARGDIVVVPSRASRSISADQRLSLLAVQIHETSGEEGKRVEQAVP